MSLVNLGHCLNPQPCRDGGDATPNLFWNGCKTTGQIALRLCVADEHPMHNFWRENFDGQARSRSYDAIMLTPSGRYLKEIMFSSALLVAIDSYGVILRALGQKMTTSDLCRSKSTFQRSFWVTYFYWQWPHAYLQCLIGNFGGFLRTMRPNTWLVFHIGMCITPLYPIRYQSGSLIQFALRRFCWWVTLSPSWMLYATNIRPRNRSTLYFVQTWTGDTLVKVLCRNDLCFLTYRVINLKIWRFSEILIFELS